MSGPPNKENAAQGGEAPNGGFDEQPNPNAVDAVTQAPSLEKRLWRHPEALFTYFFPDARRDGETLIAEADGAVIVLNLASRTVTVGRKPHSLLALVGLAQRKLGATGALEWVEYWLDCEEEAEAPAEPEKATPGAESPRPDNEDKSNSGGDAGAVQAPAAPSTPIPCSPAQRDEATPKDRAKRVRLRGWYPVWKADNALLNERCGSSAASAKAVLGALLHIANDRSNASFQVETNVIRSLAGVSLRTTKTMLYKLDELGLVEIERHHVPGTREDAPNTYTVWSCKNNTTSCNKGTTPSGNTCTTGRTSDEANDLHGNKKESAKAFYKKKRGERAEPSAEAGLSHAAQESHPHPRSW